MCARNWDEAHQRDRARRERRGKGFCVRWQQGRAASQPKPKEPPKEKGFCLTTGGRILYAPPQKLPAGWKWLSAGEIDALASAAGCKSWVFRGVPRKPSDLLVQRLNAIGAREINKTLRQRVLENRTR